MRKKNKGAGGSDGKESFVNEVTDAAAAAAEGSWELGTLG
jgi:hypothetical protein